MSIKIINHNFLWIDPRWGEVFTGKMLMSNFIHSERLNWKTFGRRWWKLEKINFPNCIAYPQNPKSLSQMYTHPQNPKCLTNTKSQNCISSLQKLTHISSLHWINSPHPKNLGTGSSLSWVCDYIWYGWSCFRKKTKNCTVNFSSKCLFEMDPSSIFSHE